MGATTDPGMVVQDVVGDQIDQSPVVRLNQQNASVVEVPSECHTSKGRSTWWKTSEHVKADTDRAAVSLFSVSSTQEVSGSMKCIAC